MQTLIAAWRLILHRLRNVRVATATATSTATAGGCGRSALAGDSSYVRRALVRRRLHKQEKVAMAAATVCWRAMPMLSPFLCGLRKPRDATWGLSRCSVVAVCSASLSTLQQLNHRRSFLLRNCSLTLGNFFRRCFTG